MNWVNKKNGTHILLLKILIFVNKALRSFHLFRQAFNHLQLACLNPPRKNPVRTSDF